MFRRTRKLFSKLATVRGYAPALILTTVATALTWLLLRVSPKNGWGVFFMLLCLLAGGWFGYGPGIVVVALLFTAIPWVLQPKYSFHQINPTSLAVTLAISLVISWLSANRAKAEQRLEERNRTLDERVRERTAELEQANSALLASESRFVAFMNAFPGAAWIEGAEAQRLYANAVAEKLGQLKGENMLITRFPIPVADGTGAMSGCIAIDISERLRAEEQARARLAELETLYNKLTPALCLLDRDLQYVRINERMALINGLSAAQHIGKRLDDVLPARMADVVGPLYRGIIETGEPVANYEFSTPSPGDASDIRHWLIDATPVTTGAGEIVGTQVIVQDVSERRRFDEKLRHTAKLESLGVLAGGIAHDFNNLLTGILGNASLAQEMVNPGHAASDLLRDMISASERAADLTRQLLAYAGKGKFFIETIAISELTRDISALVRTAIKKGAEVRLELDANAGCILADKAQLQQLIMNLVINASEAIPDGSSGVVSVRTGRIFAAAGYAQRAHCIADDQFAPGEYAFIEVEDTGTGMDAPTLERIFDPFFTTKFTGRGLGLAAASGIVRSHHGALTVASTPGQGTTFRVLFPISEAMPEKAGQPAVVDHLPELGCVLVIDDEEVVRRLVRSALSSRGYKVLVAASGSEGVELFGKHSHATSVVLLDLTMPGMDGEQTLRKLQSIQSDVKVVLSSGFDESEVALRFSGHDLAGFIQKPYSPRALADKIGSALLPSGSRGKGTLKASPARASFPIAGE